MAYKWSRRLADTGYGTITNGEKGAGFVASRC